jgi:hypothetical protein
VFLSILTYRKIAYSPRSSKLSASSPHKEARVVVGESFLQKSLYLEEKELSGVNLIAQNPTSPEPELLIAGRAGIIFLNVKSKAKKFVRFPKEDSLLSSGSRRRHGHMQIIDINNDGSSELLIRENFGTAELISQDGKTIWTYDGQQGLISYLNDVIAGDMDGDGKVEIVATFLGKSIRLLDESLRTIWEKPAAQSFKTEIVDVDGDGRKEIVYFDGKELIVRDIKGNIVSNKDMGRYMNFFSLVRWPTRSSAQLILYNDYGSNRLIDFKGNTVAEFSAPLGEDLYRAYGVTAKLKENSTEYFAILDAYSVANPSIFYLYDPAGNLIYQEILPEACDSIATLPSENGLDVILVGGAGKVYQYSNPNL